MRTIGALRASRSPDVHDPIRSRHAALHAPDAVELVAVDDRKEAPLGGSEAERVEIGNRVLRIYFRELFGADDTLLDLRPNTFAVKPGGLSWSPSPLSVHWDTAFLKGLRDTYRGFYGADDALFRSGLAALDLSEAESLFRVHFGADPSAVRFSTKDFTHTFGLVFQTAAKAKAKLSADFLPFGFFLGALYLTLEALDVTLDVRAAFETTTRAP